MANVNLKQIASAAGVSLATASRVLSGSDYPVADELRTRVMTVADELGYVPNAQAQGLLRGRTNTVGVLVGDVSDPYFSGMIGGIHEAAAASGHLVTIMNTYRDCADEIQAIRALHSQRVDVLIQCGSGLDEEDYNLKLARALTSFAGSGGSAVLVGHHDVPADLPVSRVELEADDHPTLAEHLHELGHRRVALLTGDARVLSTHVRVADFRRVFGEGLVVTEVAPTRDGGVAGTEWVLAEHPQVTAVAATADQMALGALVALRAAGISVPEQMSVAGHNDIDISRDLVPSLTSFHLPLREMGRTALAVGLRARGASPERVGLHCHLVARDSTAAPRA